MSSIILRILIPLLVGFVIFAVILALKNLFTSIPDENRDYMDPIPLKLKVIWPVVNLFSDTFGGLMGTEYRARVDNLLLRSELSYLMRAEQFLGVQIAVAIICALTAWLVMIMAGWKPGFVPLVAAIVGFLMPLLSTRDKKKTREKKIIKQLPVYLDFITMAVQSGLNLGGALRQAVDKGPDGPLKRELQRVLRDIRAGVGRVDALRIMSDRLQIKEVTSLVSSIAQSEKTGSSISETLKIQADQRRIERFQRAEKLALEAPVKLIFPLIAFIFPVTFMVLAFPIVMKVMHDL